ncbi:MAG: FAD-binding oxidoreductase [Sporichthyaceae bacterium]|nr:FAD-binding oxidoreductase [Sporichthyaceae bacterium]
MTTTRRDAADVLVIGAGVVGAACAYFAARAGLTVTVVDRGSVAGGTTGAGEGNLLVSDKEPGPELDLALLSARLWRDLAGVDADPGADGEPEPGAGLAERIEYEPKGGLVVAGNADELTRLHELAEQQRVHGVQAEPVAADALARYEPDLADGLAGGVFYPQDAQVQPMLAAAHLLKAARDQYRVEVRTTAAVVAVRQDAAGRVHAIRLADGTEVAAGAVVNAAGTWAGDVAALAGVDLPIQPRRGFILVTEPLPPRIRHKVYTAGYMADVASDAAVLETSAVVEGTRSGPILIGASRERVGFDRTLSLPVLGRLAAQAARLFPFLAEVAVIRAYSGFRPYCPDHLPVIGADPRAPGLYHACGHEGAGIGLAAATGHLLAQLLTGAQIDLDLTPLRPERFEAATA